MLLLISKELLDRRTVLLASGIGFVSIIKKVICAANSSSDSHSGYGTDGYGMNDYE